MTFKERISSWFKPTTIIITVLTLVLALVLMTNYGKIKQPLIWTLEQVITIGTQDVYAAGTPDYTCDGVADNVQFQAALNALPSTGGRLCILTGNYQFAATVSRAIDNVIIEGVGNSAYIAYNGASAVFSAGSQDGWAFRDFSTDAGGVTVTSATNWVMNHITLGATYYNYLYPSEGSGTGSITNGTNNDVIAHGLDGTPTVVNITFTEDPTNDPDFWWVDTIGGTNFTVHVDIADVGASNLDFIWEAKVR